jgi:ribosome biogenesis protein MAK21
MQRNLNALQQVMSSRASVSSRFYRALYDKLHAPELLRAASAKTKHALFLNVLYKSLKSDVSVDRVCAFLKRLLQVCLQSEPPLICAALVLMSEVCVRAWCGVV